MMADRLPEVLFHKNYNPIILGQDSLKGTCVLYTPYSEGIFCPRMNSWEEWYNNGKFPNRWIGFYGVNDLIPKEEDIEGLINSIERRLKCLLADGLYTLAKGDLEITQKRILITGPKFVQVSDYTMHLIKEHTDLEVRINP